MILKLAELMNLFIGFRCLACELVAGNINDLKPLLMELFVEFFEGFIMGSKATSRSCVYNNNNLALHVSHGKFCSIRHRNNLIIKCSHKILLFKIR